MECSIQRGGAELNGTFQLSTNEHIRTIARMKNIHYLFYITSKQNFVILIERNNFQNKQFQLQKPNASNFTMPSCSNTCAALPKTRARSDVFTQLFRSIRKVPLHAGSVPACNGTFRMERKSTASDSACNGTFICYHVTDNPPIKWQGSAWVLYYVK